MSDDIRLISGSCTTGWLDWAWGELWLTPDALVRLSRGTRGTVRAARRRDDRLGGPTVEPSAPRDEATLRERFATNRRNRWIPLADIVSADVHRGRTTTRLSVVLRDGRRVKLLWLNADPAYDALRPVLNL